MRIYALNPTESPLSVTPRLLRSVKAHEAPVIVCDVDPTGTLLATGGAESQIKLWDINGGYITHTFKGHGGVISALKFYAPEGTDNSKWMLASGADDTTVRVWSLQGRKCLAVLQSHVSVVRGLDWTKDGKILASGSRDKVVCLWDTKSWKCRNTIPVLEELETVGFLKAEEGETQVLYTGGQKNRVRLWDINKGQELTEEVAERDEHESLGISDIVWVIIRIASLISAYIFTDTTSLYLSFSLSITTKFSFNILSHPYPLPQDSLSPSSAIFLAITTKLLTSPSLGLLNPTSPLLATPRPSG